MKTDKFIKGCYNKKSGKKILFKGLIASNKLLSYGKNKKLILMIGVAKQQYIEIVVKGDFYFSTSNIFVEGKGNQLDNIYKTVECNGTDVEFS